MSNYQQLGSTSSALFLKDLLFLEKGEGREKGRETLTWERNINWLPFKYVSTGHWTHNPGMFSDRESNRLLFAFQDNAQQTEPHLSGPSVLLLIMLKFESSCILICLFSYCFLRIDDFECTYCIKHIQTFYRLIYFLFKNRYCIFALTV